jgi:hypothetical protein
MLEFICIYHRVIKARSTLLKLNDKLLHCGLQEETRNVSAEVGQETGDRLLHYIYSIEELG